MGGWRGVVVLALMLRCAPAVGALTVQHLATEAELNATLAVPAAAVAEGRIGNNATNGTFEYDLSQDTTQPTNTKMVAPFAGSVMARASGLDVTAVTRANESFPSPSTTMATAPWT